MTSITHRRLFRLHKAADRRDAGTKRAGALTPNKPRHSIARHHGPRSWLSYSDIVVETNAYCYARVNAPERDGPVSASTAAECVAGRGLLTLTREETTANVKVR
jgi:hypothetical protein